MSSSSLESEYMEFLGTEILYSVDLSYDLVASLV